MSKAITEALAAIRAAVTTDAKDTTALRLISNALKACERGEDDDSRQIIADLISNDDAPFTPDDTDSLMMMSADSLKRMRETFLAKLEEEAGEEKKEEEPAANAEGDEEKKEEDKDMTANVRKIVDAAVASALKTHSASALTAEDKEALAMARKVRTNARKDIVDRIVANSTMKQADLDKLPTATLELIANGLIAAPQPFYGGAELTKVNMSDEEAKKAADFAPQSTLAAFRARKKA